MVDWRGDGSLQKGIDISIDLNARLLEQKSIQKSIICVCIAKDQTKEDIMCVYSRCIT